MAPERLTMTKGKYETKVRANILPGLCMHVHMVKAIIFPVVMYGCESWTIRKLSAKELMLLNCGVGEESRESLGLQGDPISPS